jgi:hypothetical protein
LKNPEGFIRKAISKAWTPTSLPKKIDKRMAEFEEGKKAQNKLRKNFQYTYREVFICIT